MKKYFRGYSADNISDVIYLTSVASGFFLAIHAVAAMKLNGLIDRDILQVLVTVSGLLAFMNYYLEDVSYRVVGKMIVWLTVIRAVIMITLYNIGCTVELAMVSFVLVPLTMQLMSHYKGHALNNVKDTVHLRTLDSRQKVYSAVGATIALPVSTLLLSDVGDAELFVYSALAMSVITVAYYKYLSKFSE